MMDQASRLRDIVSQKKTTHSIKIYSVISGKGGVGKTNISINLAVRLQQMGKKVLLLDADMGMSNANIMLGIDAPRDLLTVLKGENALEDIVIKGPEGVDLITGGSNLFFMENLDTDRQKEILKSLSCLGDYDIVIIDNGAGISKQSLTFTTFAHEVILVTTPEPTALMDAYRIMKALSIYELKSSIKIIINQVYNLSQGKEAYNKLLQTANQFLNIDVECLGYVFNDIRVGKSIMEQKPVVLRYPNSLASINITEISRKVLGDSDYNKGISNLRQLGNKIIRFFG